MKRIIGMMAIITILATSLALSAGSASAHGAGGGRNHVSPDDSSCLGQLASKHAKQNVGIAHSTWRRHGNFVPSGPYDSVKDMMKAFKAYCDGSADAPND